jgi:hypothetical protein
MCPRAKRIDGITGRAEAYKACAEVSETSWFFNVFAKCIVEPNFDFNWQPDWLQGPKHWIFHSRNPVNGLEYGHMGIIAYHKQTVVDATEWGLDFTLSAEWSLEGARYAKVFVDSDNDLQQTFEWRFLEEFFDAKYNH